MKKQSDFFEKTVFLLFFSVFFLAKIKKEKNILFYVIKNGTIKCNNICRKREDVVQMVISAAVLLLRALYFFFKLFLKPGKKITMLSRQGDTASVDFALLQDALNNSDFDGEVKILCKKIAPGMAGKLAYAFHIPRQMYHIATSRVIVVDGYSIAVSVLNHKSEQSIVQIWHALNIVKNFGYQALDKPWGHKSGTAKALCMHRNYTHVVACSEKSAAVLCECFNATPDK